MGDTDEALQEERRGVQREEMKEEVEEGEKVVTRDAGVEEEEEKTVVVVVKEVQEDKSSPPPPPPPLPTTPTNVYPRPAISHEEVVKNATVFMETLRQFHDSMRTKFMIPVIGGKELDLHLLYVQVTNKGGIAKVITERKWREVIALFNFPATTTSASFVLRKYYLSLLYHFEQVYFFGVQGPLLPLPDTLQTKTPQGKLDQRPRSITTNVQRAGTSQAAHEKALMVSDASPSQPSVEDSPAIRPFNFAVTGTIDGKFDNGYFVTVQIGAQTLRGVLYHVTQPAALAGPSSSSPVMASAGNAIVPYDPPGIYRQRRKRYKYRDPERPKPNRSAYNFFFADKHSKLKQEFPHREREFSKMIGESWSKLTEEEKMVYDEIGRNDKERYRKELQKYKEKLGLRQQGNGVAREAKRAKPSHLEAAGGSA